MMQQELVDFLQKIIDGGCWDTDEEDFIVDDYAGGNVDDAFSGGVDVGRVELAQNLLERFNK
jgi:hypothetical protein